ncbi:MAG: DsbA family protein, partial [Candidatus Wildermuthbacteria bacterium]|nr:DsbA family protein [Candidatus Wildermuthbacteria bacterium]
LLLANGLEGEAKTTTKKTAAAPSNTNTNPKVAGDTAVDPSAPPAASTTVDLDGLRHVQGKGDITFVEFSDLECPFCKQFHGTMQQAMAAYGDKVRWVYKHFPLDQIHPKARKEAEAAECAGELGGNDAFWAYVDRIFEITPSNNGLDPALLLVIAQDLGLDRTRFESCLASGKYAELVEAHFQEGARLGVNGTPGSFVNGQPVRGAVPFETLQLIIDAQLAR